MTRPDDKQRTTDQASRREETAEAYAGAREAMDELEAGESVPTELSDWPQGKAKFLTFGDTDDQPYGEGPTAMLGPAGLRHHEDGSVSVGGEKVDNPEDYKGKPLPGGPTDPNTPQLAGERDTAVAE